MQHVDGLWSSLALALYVRLTVMKVGKRRSCINAVVSEPKPNRNDWGRKCTENDGAHEHDEHVIV